MSEQLPSEETISLKAHRRILFEIRTKIAAINLDLGAYQDPDRTADEIDSLVDWIDTMGPKA